MEFQREPVDPSLRDPLPGSPLALLARWREEARERSGMGNPGAMALATVDGEGHPHVRIVLERGLDASAGRLVFFTHRRSAKGRELAATPRAAACLHWDALARQVRIEGPVTALPDADSDAYWSRRHPLARIAGYGSAQSEPIASREALLARLEAVRERFGDGANVPRPADWGGYVLHCERVELWVGSEGRAHDRASWERDLAPDADGGFAAASDWRVRRLQP